MIVRLKRNVLVGCLVLSSISVLYLGRHAMECSSRSPGQGHQPDSMFGGFNASLGMVYNKDTPLIFIGGFPRSGTTLMRVMLDAHPAIRCGEETRVIPRVLAMKETWSRSEREKMRLDEAGVTDKVLDSAIRAFVLEVIVRHGEPAPFLCNKDPFALRSLSYLAKIFPHAKFVLMIRDGRAAVHSLITRKVSIAGFDLTNFRECLSKWNHAIGDMYEQCLDAGGRCLPMRYELLVLNPELWTRRLLGFLEIPWSEAVLHHEKLIGKVGGASLSKVEKSSDQVMRPVNSDSLSKWVGHIPEELLSDVPQIAPMLARLGYDPLANPPNYTRLDPLLQDNIGRLQNFPEGMKPS